MDLEQNNQTGIAVVTLNNPEMKNAMTGNKINTQQIIVTYIS